MTPKQKFSEISLHSFLSECIASPDLVMKFGERSRKRVFDRDQVLFEKGDPAKSVYLVKAGDVGLVTHASPFHGIGFLARPGSLIGLPAAFSNHPYSMTAIVCKGAEIDELTQQEFREMIAADPALSLSVLQLLAAETRSARIAITEVGSKSRSRSRLPD